MLNNQGTEAKYATTVTLDGTAGIKGNADGVSCFAETQARVEISGVGGTNVVGVYGRLRSSASWTLLKSLTGVVSDTVDISTYDYVRYAVITADGTGTIIASGFFFKLSSGGSGAVTSVNTQTGDVIITASGLGAELVANKAVDFSTVNDILYPSVKAVNDQSIINALIFG